jgi:hypothetical protein
LTREFVKLLSPNLLGGIHWRGLFDLTTKLLQHKIPIDGLRPLGDLFIPHSAFRTPRSRYVSCVRLKPELHDRLVFLLVLIEKLREPRRFADEYHHHSGRERIECAGVADAFRLERATDAGDDVVRRDTRGLIDDQQSVHVI